jgi:hypothetical protein
LCPPAIRIYNISPDLELALVREYFPLFGREVGAQKVFSGCKISTSPTMHALTGCRFDFLKLIGGNRCQSIPFAEEQGIRVFLWIFKDLPGVHVCIFLELLLFKVTLNPIQVLDPETLIRHRCGNGCMTNMSIYS